MMAPADNRAPVGWFFSAAPWIATAYLTSYLIAGPVLFAVALTVVLVSFGLSITVLGLPLLVGAALIVRGLAEIERGRARLVVPPVHGEYRSVTGTGLFAHIKGRWSDRATLRDLVYLILMFPILLALDVVALAIWLACLAGVALPFWYWSIPQDFDGGPTVHGVMIGYTPGPHSTFGDGGFGIWVGDLRTALITAAVFFVLSMLAAQLVTGAARLHGTIVRNLLGPYVDPLAAAKRMLIQPGPLPVR